MYSKFIFCTVSLRFGNQFLTSVCMIFRAFFGSLYRCLARGGRAVLQFYADNVKQSEMIVTSAMRAGFAGGVVVDWPHRYEFNFLTAMV